MLQQATVVPGWQQVPAAANALSLRRQVPAAASAPVVRRQQHQHSYLRQRQNCQLHQQRPAPTPATSSSVPWYECEHPQQLRATLGLPSWRFQTLVHKEPALLAYQQDTLQLTLTALCGALHLNTKTVVSIIEQRPALLLQPQEAVEVLQQLSQLLGRTTQQTAFLLSPHPQLLAMQPQRLQQHIHDLCEVMHWPASELRSLTSAAATGPASFLQLLAMPLAQVAGRLQDLGTGLDAAPAVAAQLAQHHPALLNMSPAVLRSRLFALAEAEGSSCAQLLSRLDAQQVKGLSGLLLLSPARLLEQMRGLQALLQSLQDQQVQQRLVQQPDPLTSTPASSDGGGGSSSSSSGSEGVSPGVAQLAARLLLRLGTRVTLAEVQVRLVMLQGTTRKVQQWHEQLARAGDADLAALLSASTEGLAQAKFLAECRGPEAGNEPLLGVVQMPAGEFSKRWPGYADWLSGMA